ncbi:MAG: hypothetical protein IT430_03080 [Phycisphaerales bacterium]|nr:hypothetical protein [Phycisphaerales bacterium]
MASDIHLSLLDRVKIASPCTAKWEDMAGDDVTRHCSQCNLDVHNLSAMTREQAESFLREHTGGGRVCGRIFRRTDGTILMKDCPVGLAAIRARARRTAARVAAALAAMVSATAFAQWRSGQHEEYPLSNCASVRDFNLFDRIRSWVRSAPPQQVSGGMWMGAIALPDVRTWGETLTNTPDGKRGFE